MRMLVRRDPFREMASWRHAMNRLFEEVADNADYWDRTTTWALPLDVAESEEGYLVTASIPGVNPDDLEITLSDNVLSIKGEVRESNELQDAQWHLRERRFGTFQRSITLPAPVDADAIEASYQDGVLNLSVPKVAEVRPRRIAVRAN